MSARERWTVLGAEEVFAARPYVVVTRERIRTGSGVEVPDFYRVDLSPFVVCVPRTVDGRIVTLWSYKHGPRQWGLSFPAGYLDEAEPPEDACRRELLEETGYAADALLPLGSFVDNGNQRGSVGNYFFADRCALASFPNSGDLEQMDVRLMTPAAIDAALRDGAISVVHHVAAWLLARPLCTDGRAA